MHEEILMHLVGFGVQPLDGFFLVPLVQCRSQQ